MNTEEGYERTLTVRDSVSGIKLYEVIKLNGEVEIFDYVTNSKRKVGYGELSGWLSALGVPDLFL